MSQAADHLDSMSQPAMPAWRPQPVLAVIACVVAAALAFAVVNQLHPVFPFEDLPEQGPYPSAELMAQYKAAEYAFQSSNGAVNGGVLGALMGLLVGALTASRRVAGIAMGLIVGAAAGALGGYVAGNLVAGAIYQAGSQSMVQSVGYLTIYWGLIAAAVCGAMAVVHNPRQLPAAILTGLVIAAIGAILYNVVASLVFPLANLVLITPNTASERLVWALCFGIALGVGIAFGFRAKDSTPRPWSMWLEPSGSPEMINWTYRTWRCGLRCCVPLWQQLWFCLSLS